MLISKTKLNKLFIIFFVFVLFFSFSFKIQKTQAQLAGDYIVEYRETPGGVYHFHGPETEALCTAWWKANRSYTWELITHPGIDISETKPCYHKAKIPPPTPPPATINTDTTYTLLAPLPGLEEGVPFETNPKLNPCPFGKYLNIMIKLFFGICGVLAVVMMVMGGIQYMTSDLVSSKEEGKKTITNAILGLILALGAYLILFTINPDLLNACLNNVKPQDITIGPVPESTEAFSPVSGSSLSSLGIYCPGKGGALELSKIANSFKNKVTYSQSKRNKIDSSVPTLYLDCSSFVKQVYKCAGLDFSGDRTNSIFPGKEIVKTVSTDSINNIPLKIGNLLGWMQGESSKYPGSGHIVMYIGNGNFIEVQGSGGTNKAVLVRSVNSYSTSYKHVIRLP